MIMFGGICVIIFGVLVGAYCVLDIAEESDNTDKRNRG
jgi:hypothetical protein